MEFVEMRDLLCKNFAEMTKDTTHLFEVAVDKDEISVQRTDFSGRFMGFAIAEFKSDI